MDFEAFKCSEDDSFIIKELCILDTHSPLTPLYYMFGSDKSFTSLSPTARRQYRYQTKQIHGLEWSEGISRYCRNCVLHHIIKFSPFALNGIFYVMGLEKMEFLANEFPELRFIEYHLTFNRLPSLPNNLLCYHREHGEHCAYRTCMRLYHHYLSLPS